MIQDYITTCLFLYCSEYELTETIIIKVKEEEETATKRMLRRRYQIRRISKRKYKKEISK